MDGGVDICMHQGVFSVGWPRTEVRRNNNVVSDGFHKLAGRLAARGGPGRRV